MWQRLIGFGFVFILMGASTLAGDDVPAWLRQAAAANVPAYDKKVPAVVLLDESKVTVGEDGGVTRVNYYAVRILTREGRDEAVAKEGYETDLGKVREMRAWMIRPSGEVKKYGKDEVVDISTVKSAVYEESRVKIIDASADAEPGAVFGYETTSESRSLFAHLVWRFQHNLPVLLSRCTLTLPAGWRAESVTLNHAKVEPALNGSSHIWELRSLPFIEDEPGSPPVSSLAPRVAISYFPAAGAKDVSGKTFDNWVDVSRWYAELSDPQATLDDPLRIKARELTANAQTEFERIRAIGRYVQGLQYVSIQMGAGRYRPHAATEVFAKSYGDCKDKANLMRAMLKAIKIPSYMVLIYSGDPTYVREEWSSPMQFNHCIVAIKVSDQTSAAAILPHPSLGRLLIFDATDEYTPVGDLPDHEQGSLALIAAGEGGGLLRMPVTPPEANRLERQTEVTITAEGAITASIREHAIGQAAADSRRLVRRLSRPDYQKMIERWITRGANGATISKIEPSDSNADGSFALNVEFTAPAYGQSMRARMLVFKPAVVSRRESLSLTDSTRQHPIRLEAQAYTETVRVKLPAGFAVDEMPEAVKLDASFGNYSATFEVKDWQLIFTRSLVLRSMTIPPEHYAQVRSFFGRMLAAEQAPVVLIKK